MMIRRAALVVPAVVWGIASAFWTPRGPLTNAEALWSIGISAAIGVAGGRISRSRWAMLITPVAFVVAVELARLRLSGPSVDAPHLSPFGIVALVTGRGVQGLLSVFPMALGSAYGRGVTGWVGRTGTGVCTAALILVTGAVAIPARTSPVPGGIAELTSIEANHHRLGMLIRGADRAAPVLLFLPGAPGGSEFGAVRAHLAALERSFVMVTLDRRGAGTSYPALDPTATVTVDSAVADTLAVTDYLRHRFHQDRVYLLAHSGGSIIGVLAVRRHPEKYRAYIGTGQAVDPLASDRIFYADILAWARATGHRDVVRQLVAQGPPPYRDVYAYEPIMTYENEAYQQAPTDFGTSAAEYTPLQKVHVLNAILDTWSALYPRMQDVDLRRDASRLDVPVYFVQGGREMRGLTVLFDQWYRQLQAPRKQLEVFDTAGHRAMFEQPDRFAAVLNQIATGSD
jgi:pimeloyl-ACP methyl ester carboxylesterase